MINKGIVRADVILKKGYATMTKGTCPVCKKEFTLEFHFANDGSGMFLQIPFHRKNGERCNGSEGPAATVFASNDAVKVRERV